MTKKLFLFLQLLLVINYSNAQTTETFETESNNSTTFTDNGLAFSITSQLGGPFDVQGLYPGTGWSGTANDHRYIDNDSYAAFNRPTQFTISSSGAAPFTLKSIWLFLSTDGLVLQPSGSVTITGRLGGVDKFTAIATSGFNNSMSVNNGFTFINMATFGGTDNSGISIDQYVITTSNNINYVCLDAMRWQQGASAISSTTKTNVTCYGGSNGTASVTAGGAVSYDWTPGNPSGDGTASVTGLTAGNWTCTVTFSGGSTSSAVITIGQPSAPVDATLSQTNILCYGASAGSASVTAYGGTGSYSYYWSNGATGPSITGLPAGIYSVVIFDGNNCTSFKNFNITQPSEFTATTSQNNVSCYGSNNGSATVSPSGGVGSYTYLWSNGATGSSATGLAPGNYSVTIRDANNCSLSKNFSITQPQALVASTYQENVLTYGGTTGAASVTPSGGAGGYSYLWSTGATGQSIAGVAAGNYSVTITDASNCSIIKNFAIMGPVLFVKQGANGSGSSWSDASGNLQAMINLATAGMQVWVAGGTYQPQANTSYSMKEGVKIYGGFPASGLPVMENRNYSIYATVLEGSNNRVINNDGNWLTNAAVLDGFTILGGTTGENGAGMKNSGSYPYIANCIFKSNNALNWGGGIFNNGAGSTMLVNCLFYNNLAGGGGASFDNLGTTTQYINCTVTKNHSGQNGGGIHTYQDAVASIKNSIIWGNTCGAGGREVYSTGGGIVNAFYCLISNSANAITGSYNATAVQNGNPLFTDSDNNNYSLSTGSPAIDNGNSSLYTNAATTADLAGSPRLSGDKIDIGAYERPSSDCSITTTWNGSSWSNGVPVNYDYAVVIAGNYNSGINGEITACSLTINSGSVIVASGDVITIKGAVAVNPSAALKFENNAHLMQGGIVNNNIGNMEVHRNSSELFRQDYTMWASPVSGQGLRDFSPETIYSRFYSYNPTTDNFTGIFSSAAAPDTNFAEGQGYLIRMPNGAPEAGYVEGITSIMYDGTFTGTPNNGSIAKAVVPASQGVQGYNAIGNPYPSPISIPAFFAANNGNTDGTIYLWRRKNGSEIASAYCTVNAQGEYVDNGQLETENPNGFIQTGQGFIVKALTSTINFNNSMRSATTSHDGSFFRMNNSTPETADDAHRIWLNLSKGNTQIAQMLVGYRTNATMGIDLGIDAPFINDVETGLNSVIDDKAYAIQGRSLPFDENDIVPLEFKTNAAGSYTISIDHMDGIFTQEQNIFLKDHLLGVTHNIKESGYTFTTDAGIFNTRFEVVYVENALSTDEPKLDTNTLIIYKKERSLIINSGTAIMENVKLYDMRGRLVYERSNINAGETVISDLRAEEQVLIVKVETDKGTVSKKVIY